MNRPNISRFASAYLERGWSFYPTQPKSKVPLSPALPLITRADGTTGRGWSPFQTSLPQASDVRTWFTNFPDANLALVTGSVSRLVILDLDTQAAIDAFCALCGIEHLSDLSTPLVASRQGYHAYFEHPGFDVRGTLGIEHLDVKGDGGCCTAPPSVHASGHVYKFEMSPARYDLQPLPLPVLDRLKQEQLKREAPRLPVAPIQFPARDTSNYGRVALRNALSDLASTTVDRNKALNRIAFSLGGIVAAGALDWSTTYHALEAQALAVGLSRREVTPTLLSGLGDGTQRPRVIQDRQTRHAPRRPRTLAEMNQSSHVKGAFA